MSFTVYYDSVSDFLSTQISNQQIKKIENYKYLYIKIYNNFKCNKN